MKTNGPHADEQSTIELTPAPKPEPGCGIARTTRRRALRLIGMTAVGGYGWTTCGAAEREAAGARGDRVADDALDEAYRILQSQEPRGKRGLATHTPMVAEALCALGHPDRAVKWVENDRAPLRDLPRPSVPIDARRWREALGPKRGVNSWEASHARWGDWRELFIKELSERPWREVLDLWVSRLAPGLSGAATHGVIRTAHASRAIAQRETPARRAELARGLAYWAASYEELPARPHDGPRFKTFASALAEVPLYWEAFGQRPEGIIVEGLRGVQKLDQFAKVRDLIAAPADLGAALSALTATFCRVYLRHGTKRDAIAFVHAVTGPCSLRRLAPHVRPETARAALPYAWQAAAGIYSAYARPGDEPHEPEAKLTRGELTARAIESDDEHAIKFSEVMLAEHALNPDPAYLAAAEDAIRRL